MGEAEPLMRQEWPTLPAAPGDVGRMAVKHPPVLPSGERRVLTWLKAACQELGTDHTDTVYHPPATNSP